MSGPTFPFTAVRGHDDAQLALLLAAVDPGIGGVLLRGDKGSGKSTLARALAGLLPAAAPFVELPVGASQDSVVGSLDLEAVLREGEVQLRPGLLARAHGGVLYVDEVNLLPDHLVDVLLDAAASGQHRVERDGVSVVHPARFVLVGSMNPEEGELRPQLLDRFGLCVSVRTPTDPTLRAALVRDRIAFDRAGLDALAPAVEADRRLAVRLAGAKVAEVSEETAAFAARLALAAGAEGLRADLVLCRAAAARAGLEGRSAATPDDVEGVAHLVLAHRRRRRPFDPPALEPDELAAALAAARQGERDTQADKGQSPDSLWSDGSAGAPHGPDPSPAQASATSDAAEIPQGGADQRSSWGELAPEALGGSADPVGLGRRRVESAASDRDGIVVGDRAMSDRPGRLAVLPSVKASLARRAVEQRPAAESAIRLAPGDLRQTVERSPVTRCIILAVDSSGSMVGRQRLEAATAAVLGLLADAYRRRDKVSLVGFGGHGAEVALPPTASVEVARARLADLPAGGTTPLAEGLRQAHEVAGQVRRVGEEPFVVLLTDGRATGGGNAVARALSAAEAMASEGLSGVVLDAEAGPGRLGIARRLAEALRWPWIQLSNVDGASIEEAIRASGSGR